MTAIKSFFSRIAKNKRLLGAIIGLIVAIVIVTVVCAMLGNDAKTPFSLSSREVTLEVGESEQLQVVNKAGGDILYPQWSSNAPSVATVDETGCVTAVSPGTAKVTAVVSLDGKEYMSSSEVTVVDKKADKLSVEGAAVPDVERKFILSQYSGTVLPEMTQGRITVTDEQNESYMVFAASRSDGLYSSAWELDGTVTKGDMSKSLFMSFGLIDRTGKEQWFCIVDNGVSRQRYWNWWDTTIYPDNERVNQNKAAADFFFSKRSDLQFKIVVKNDVFRAYFGEPGGKLTLAWELPLTDELFGGFEPGTEYQLAINTVDPNSLYFSNVKTTVGDDVCLPAPLANLLPVMDGDIRFNSATGMYVMGEGNATAVTRNAYKTVELTANFCPDVWPIQGFALKQGDNMATLKFGSEGYNSYSIMAALNGGSEWNIYTGVDFSLVGYFDYEIKLTYDGEYINIFTYRDNTWRLVNMEPIKAADLFGEEFDPEQGIAVGIAGFSGCGRQIRDIRLSEKISTKPGSSKNLGPLPVHSGSIVFDATSNVYIMGSSSPTAVTEKTYKNAELTATFCPNTWAAQGFAIKQGDNVASVRFGSDGWNSFILRTLLNGEEKSSYYTRMDFSIYGAQSYEMKMTFDGKNINLFTYKNNTWRQINWEPIAVADLLGEAFDASKGIQVGIAGYDGCGRQIKNISVADKVTTLPNTESAAKGPLTVHIGSVAYDPDGDIYIMGEGSPSALTEKTYKEAELTANFCPSTWPAQGFTLKQGNDVVTLRFGSEGWNGFSIRTFLNGEEQASYYTKMDFSLYGEKLYDMKLTYDGTNINFLTYYNDTWEQINMTTIPVAELFGSGFDASKGIQVGIAGFDGCGRQIRYVKVADKVTTLPGDTKETGPLDVHVGDVVYDANGGMYIFGSGTATATTKATYKEAELSATFCSNTWPIQGFAVKQGDNTLTFKFGSEGYDYAHILSAVNDTAGPNISTAFGFSLYGENNYEMKLTLKDGLLNFLVKKDGVWKQINREPVSLAELLGSAYDSNSGISVGVVGFSSCGRQVKSVQVTNKVTTSHSDDPINMGPLPVHEGTISYDSIPGAYFFGGGTGTAITEKTYTEVDITATFTPEMWPVQGFAMKQGDNMITLRFGSEGYDSTYVRVYKNGTLVSNYPTLFGFSMYGGNAYDIKLTYKNNEAWCYLKVDGEWTQLTQTPIKLSDVLGSDFNAAKGIAVGIGGYDGCGRQIKNVILSEAVTLVPELGLWDRYEVEKAEQRAAEYAANGEDGVTTIFVGDSFMDPAFWDDFEAHIGTRKALRLGIGGSTAEDWINYIKEEIFLHNIMPKNIVFNLGNNDIHNGEGLVTYQNNMKQLLETVHALTPDSKLFMYSVAHRAGTDATNLLVDEANAYMKKWCSEQGWVTFVDISDQLTTGMLWDGIHPSSIYYKTIFLPTLEAAGCEFEGGVASGELLPVKTGDAVYDKFTGEYTMTSGIAVTQDAYARVELVATFKNSGWPVQGFALKQGDKVGHLWFGTEGYDEGHIFEQDNNQNGWLDNEYATAFPFSLKVGGSYEIKLVLIDGKLDLYLKDADQWKVINAAPIDLSEYEICAVDAEKQFFDVSQPFQVGVAGGLGCGGTFTDVSITEDVDVPEISQVLTKLSGDAVYDKYSGAYEMTEGTATTEETYKKVELTVTAKTPGWPVLGFVVRQGDNKAQMIFGSAGYNPDVIFVNLNGGSNSQIPTNTRFSPAGNSSYDLKLVYDGTAINLYKREANDNWSQINQDPITLAALNEMLGDVFDPTQGISIGVAGTNGCGGTFTNIAVREEISTVTVTHVPAVEATASKDGCAEYWTRSDSDKYYGDEDCITVYTEKPVIPAHTHKLKLVCNNDGTHSENCTVANCDKKGATTACTYSGNSSVCNVCSVKPRADGTDVRAMSFNILREDLPDYPDAYLTEYRQEGVSGTIRAYLPDIVGLQEVSANWYAALDETLTGENGPYAWVVTKNLDGVASGVTMLYNTETVKLLDGGIVHYSGTTAEMRSMVWGCFEKLASGERFVAVSTHWDVPSIPTLQASESTELAQFVKTLKEQYMCPVISVGDFNINETASAYQNYLISGDMSEVLHNAKQYGAIESTWHQWDDRNTYPSEDAYLGIIDHITYSSNVQAEYYSVIYNQALHTASDHYPVYADLNLLQTEYPELPLFEELLPVKEGATYSTLTGVYSMPTGTAMTKGTYFDAELQATFQTKGWPIQGFVVQQGTEQVLMKFGTCGYDTDKVVISLRNMSVPTAFNFSLEANRTYEMKMTYDDGVINLFVMDGGEWKQINQAPISMTEILGSAFDDTKGVQVGLVGYSDCGDSFGNVSLTGTIDQETAPVPIVHQELTTLTGDATYDKYTGAYDMIHGEAFTAEAYTNVELTATFKSTGWPKQGFVLKQGDKVANFWFGTDGYDTGKIFSNDANSNGWRDNEFDTAFAFSISTGGTYEMKAEFLLGYLNLYVKEAGEWKQINKDPIDLSKYEICAPNVATEFFDMTQPFQIGVAGDGGYSRSWFEDVTVTENPEPPVTYEELLPNQNLYKFGNVWSDHTETPLTNAYDPFTGTYTLNSSAGSDTVTAAETAKAYTEVELTATFAGKKSQGFTIRQSDRMYTLRFGDTDGTIIVTQVNAWNADADGDGSDFPATAFNFATLADQSYEMKLSYKDGVANIFWNDNGEWKQINKEAIDLANVKRTNTNTGVGEFDRTEAAYVGVANINTAGGTISNVSLKGVEDVAQPTITSWSEITDLSGTYKLGANLTADAVLGDFTGTLDGAGYTITTNSKLFTSLNGATVKNLTIDVTATTSVSPLANYAYGSTITGVTVKTSDGSGAVVNTEGYCAGGLVGTSYGSKFINCTNENLPVTVTNNSVGGIVGYTGNNSTYGASTFTNCVNKATITATAGSCPSAGGIVGYTDDNATFTGCSNTGTVTAPVDAANAYSCAGGIVGYVGNQAVAVKDSSSTGGKVTTNGAPAGSLVGKATSNLTLTGNTFAAEGQVNGKSAANRIFGTVTNLTSGSQTNTYTITYVLGDGAVNGTGNPATATHGQTITLADPTRDGYEFNGWQDLEGKTVTVTSDLTLTAQWSKAAAIDLSTVITGANATVTLDANKEYYLNSTLNFTFTGTLTGKGATVVTNAPLFTSLGSGANISSLTIDLQSNITSNSGVLAGTATGAKVTDVTVKTSYGSAINAEHAGGFVDTASGCTFTRCRNENVNVTTTKDAAGGLVYYTKDSTNYFYGCSNAATIIGANAAGGIVGWGSAGDTFADSDSTHTTNTGSITAAQHAGGIVGIVDTEAATLTNCVNSGAITGNDKNGNNAGGMIGTANNTTKLTACVNSGKVTGDVGAGSAGGMVGNVASGMSTLTDCVNSGEVLTTKSTGTQYNYGAGGLVGKVSNGSVSISGGSNTGYVHAANACAGGAVGVARPDAANITVNISNFTNGSATDSTLGKIAGQTAGGIMGYANGNSVTSTVTITGCTNNGAIAAETSETTYNGGIMGCYEGGASGTTTITNCTNNGNVSGVGSYNGNISGYPLVN